MTDRHRASIIRGWFLAQALFRPRALAAAIESTLDWRCPAALILLAVVALDFLSLPLFLRAVPQMAPSGLSPEMLAELVQRSRLLRPVQILLSPLGWLAQWIVTAFLLRLMAMVMNHPLRLRTFFVLVVHANLVHLLETLSKNLLLWLRFVATGTIVLDPPVGMDALIRPSSVPLSTILSYANPFEGWFLILLIGGTAALCRTTRARAAVIVLPVWGFWLAAHLAVALVREILTRQLGM